MRLCVSLLFMVSVVNAAQTQQAPCTVVVNVTKMLMPYPLQPLPPGGKYLPEPPMVPERRLAPGDFVAHDGLFHHVPIASVEPDEGPRRIVLVATFGEGWRTYVRQWKGRDTASIWPGLTDILAAARPQDSFALLAVGGPRLGVPLGSSRDALGAGVEALSHPNPDGPEGASLFDGLLEAASWFGSPQIGDSIFELGDIRRWRWDKAKASRLRRALVSRGIRLFSLGGAHQNFGGDDVAIGVQHSPLANLCEESGGAWQTIGYLGPDARDDMLWEWKNAAKALYDMATFAYVLRLPRTGPHVKIQLTLPAQRFRAFSYPNPLPVCP